MDKDPRPVDVIASADIEEEAEAGEVAAVGEVRLSDGVVDLRAWRPEDAPAVFAACQDAELVRHTYVPQPYTIEHAKGYIELCNRALGDGSAAGFAIVDASTDRVLGAMSRPPLDGHRASFGYWMVPSARGRGFCARALRLMADWTLETTDAIRLELYTDLDNPASGRVAEKAGFERESIRRPGISAATANPST